MMNMNPKGMVKKRVIRGLIEYITIKPTREANPMAKRSKILYKKNRTIRIQAIDYVRFLLEIDLDSAIFEDKRSDELIESILNDAGFGATQFELDTGVNEDIKFAWFKKGETAGDQRSGP